MEVRCCGHGPGPSSASCPRASGALAWASLWGGASALGLWGATGASLGGGGGPDPAERRARARCVGRGERLCLDHPSVETPAAVALEAASHRQLQGVVPWEEWVTSTLCPQSPLTLGRAFLWEGAVAGDPLLQGGDSTPACPISWFARSSALGGVRETTSSSPAMAPGCSPSWPQ